MAPDPKRLDLHELLESIPGVTKAYFQPPSNIKMVYPAIVYKLDRANTDFADNLPYRYKKRYMITVIDRDPETQIPHDVAKLPMCTLDRTYSADDLNHYVLSIFF